MHEPFQSELYITNKTVCFNIREIEVGYEDEKKYILKNGKTRVRDGRPLYCKKTAQINKDLSI